MRLDGDDVASLRQELSWLTKRDGFIQRRLTQAPIVDEVLRGSLEDSFEKLRHRFTSAIYTLPIEEADLLLDVFGLSPETTAMSQLIQRREFHGKKIGRKVDTVRTREEAALELLHSRLITGRYAQSPLVLDVPEMHGGIIYEETTTLLVVENLRWKHTIEKYCFANMAGEIDYVTIGRSHPAQVTTHTSGAFSVNSRAVEGAGWNDHFWHLDRTRTHREPMHDKTRYELLFKLTPPQDEQDPQPVKLASRAFHHRSLLATIKVKFIGPTPGSIWTFRDASPFARPTTANEYNQTSLDEDATATLTMRDVHGGLFSGFAWNW